MSILVQNKLKWGSQIWILIRSEQNGVKKGNSILNSNTSSEGEHNWLPLDILTQLKHLVESWYDDFSKNLFSLHAGKRSSQGMANEDSVEADGLGMV